MLQMMNLIRTAQDELVAELQAKREALMKAEEKLGSVRAEFGLSERACNLLYQVVQVSLFGANADVTLQDAATHLEVTAQSARKYASELEQADLAETTSRRPLKFKLSRQGEETFGVANAVEIR